MNLFTTCIAALAVTAVLSGTASAQQQDKRSYPAVHAVDLSGLDNPLVVINDFKTDYRTFVRYEGQLQELRVVKGEEAVKLYGPDAAGGVILAQPAAGVRFVNYAMLEKGNEAIRTTPHDGIALDGRVIDTKKLLIRQDDIRGFEVISQQEADGVTRKYLNIKTH